MATVFTMTGASTVNASGTKRPVRSAGPRDRIRPKKQREEVPAGDEPTHELRGGALHRRQWEPVQKPVQAEDEEDEAEKDARNDDGFGSHG
jgi:hypothetical protein